MLLLWLSAGVVAGVLAGLLGLGGGLVMIPLLNALYAWQGLAPAVTQHVALATSLAVIIPTGLQSARAHAARGALDRDTLRRVLPWVALGALLAAVSARWLPGVWLQFLYLLLGVWVLASLSLIRPAAEAVLPEVRRAPLMGSLIGVLSGWLGIGGGTLSTPWLLSQGRSMHMAVGTAAALGVPIAVAGTLGYVLAGWGVPARPPLALGFVDVPAAAALLTGSVLAAPWGAALAHRCPDRLLRRLFMGVVVLGMARMGWQLAQQL